MYIKLNKQLTIVIGGATDQLPKPSSYFVT